jgi:hypothetical protein
LDTWRESAGFDSVGVKLCIQLLGSDFFVDELSHEVQPIIATTKKYNYITRLGSNTIIAI